MRTTRTSSIVLAGTLVLAAVAAGAPAAAAAPPDGRTVTVVDVVDGDTIDVRFRNGTVDTVRLVGVDTPETFGEVAPEEFGLPDTPAARAHLRAEASDASAFLEARINGTRVRLLSDPNTDDRGSFGRLLRYVRVDGATINAKLLERGHARVFASGFSNESAYLELADAARAADRGVWSFTAATTDATTLVVSDTRFDAPGPEFDNLDGEYVTLRNVGDDPIALEGWTVRDPANNSYTFGGRTLAAGATVRLVTGVGTDDDTTVYQDLGSPVWNNDGDRVIVEAPDGTVVQNATVTADGRVDCRLTVAPIVGRLPPTDPDCDGAHEDVDGDGRADFRDVIQLLFATDLTAGQERAVDVDGDGRFSFFDVVELLFEVT